MIRQLIVLQLWFAGGDFYHSRFMSKQLVGDEWTVCASLIDGYIYIGNPDPSKRARFDYSAYKILSVASSIIFSARNRTSPERKSRASACYRDQVFHRGLR